GLPGDGERGPGRVTVLHRLPLRPERAGAGTAHRAVNRPARAVLERRRLVPAHSAQALMRLSSILTTALAQFHGFTTLDLCLDARVGKDWAKGLTAATDLRVAR